MNFKIQVYIIFILSIYVTIIGDGLTCLLFELLAQIESGKILLFYQGCILSSCLFNLYAEYIKRNSGLDDVQAGIKISGRNSNKLRYVDDTTLIAESKEERAS